MLTCLFDLTAVVHTRDVAATLGSAGVGENRRTGFAQRARGNLRRASTGGSAGGAVVFGGVSGFFGAVPSSDPVQARIRTNTQEGMAAAATYYCPNDPVTRAQMAVFLLIVEHGSGYAPPACAPPGIFGDVPCPGGFAVDWIEQLYAEGVTAGCSSSPLLYCPDNPNTRGQMAVFLVKTFGR